MSIATSNEHHPPMSDIPVLHPEDFAKEAFLRDNMSFVTEYALLRIRGVYRVAAFRRVFGYANCDHPTTTATRIDNLEASDTYNKVFDAKLKTMPIDEILNERKALQQYLDIAGNPGLKESVRVAALKEASVLAGLTVIDESGRSVQRRTLADFYNDLDKKRAADTGDSNTAPLH